MDEHWPIARESRQRIAKLEHLTNRTRGGAQGAISLSLASPFLHEKTKKSEISFSAERAAIKVDTEAAAAAAVSARHCASSGEAT